MEQFWSAHIESVDNNSEITTIVNYSGNEQVLQDHFPWRIIVPGALIIESMISACDDLLLLIEKSTRGRWMMSIPVMVSEVKFYRPICPDVNLRICAKVVSSRGNISNFEINVWRGKTRMSKGKVTLQLIDPNDEEFSQLMKEKKFNFQEYKGAYFLKRMERELFQQYKTRMGN